MASDAMAGVIAPQATFNVVAQPHPLRPDVMQGDVAVGCTLADLGVGPRVVAFVDGARQDDLGYAPQAGQSVLLRAVPGDALGSAFGFFLNPFLYQFSFLIDGVTDLISGLIPLPSFDLDAPGGLQAFGSTASTANRARPYGVVNRLYGTKRFFPPLHAKPYTEQAGGQQYLRMLFDLGYGPLVVDTASIKIGDTLLSDYEHEKEILQGEAGDPPLTLYTRNVIETPLADVFNLDGTTATRTTEVGAREISIDIGAPTLVRFSDEGKKRWVKVGFTVEMRLAGSGGAWTLLSPANATLTGDGDYGAVAGSAGSVYYLFGQGAQPYRVNVLVRLSVTGQYDIRVTRTSMEAQNVGQQVEPNDDIASEFRWTALRTIGTDIAQSVPANRALLALRIKITDQLNGTVDSLSLVAASKLQTWNGTAWVLAATSNPAWVYRDVLTGIAAARPLDVAKLDDDTLKAWAVECVANGYEFNGLFDGKTTVFEALKSVALVGRAAFQIANGQYSVVRDRPGLVPVQMFTPRNLAGFTWKKNYTPLPHALRVKFENREADWIEDTLEVFADGYSRDGSGGTEVATDFQELSLFGVTLNDQVFAEARYRLGIGTLRPETFTWTAKIDHLVCRRGDVVRTQHDSILVGLGSGRITAVGGGSVTLDEQFTIESGKTYQLRIRKDDASSAIATVTNAPGVTSALTLSGGVPAGVQVGDLAAFGESDLVALELLITGIKPVSDLEAEISAVTYSPAVHDAGPLPPYDPLISRPVVTPPAPIILNVLSGIEAGQVNSNGGVSGRIIVSYLFPASEVNVRWVEGRIRRADELQFSQLRRDTPTGTYYFDDVDGESDYVVSLRGVSATEVPGPFTEELVEASDAVPDAITALTLVEQIDSPSTPNRDLSTVIATVTPPAAPNYAHAIIEYRRIDAAAWFRVGPTDENEQARTILNRDGTTYEFRARAVSVTGFEDTSGPVEEITLSVESGGPPISDPDTALTPDAALDVENLRLFGLLPAATQFLGPDAWMEWDAVTPPAGQTLRDYRVRIRDANTLNIMRVLYTLNTNFKYALAQNAADNAEGIGASTPFPTRSLRFEVTARTVQGKRSNAVASKDVVNPLPVIAGLSVSASSDTITIKFDRPEDGDYARTIVYASTASGFFPGPSNVVYDGFETTPIVIPGFSPSTTVYYRISALDGFGGGLTNQASITTSAGMLDTTPPTAPSSLSLSTAIESVSFSPVAYLKATWTASTDDSGKLRYEVEYWTDPSRKTTDFPTLNEFSVKPVQIGATYFFRVRAVDYSGNASAWTSAASILIAADTTAPANVTGAAAVGGLDKVVVSWTNPADADFLTTRVYRGTSAGFTADAGSLIADTRADTLVDAEVVFGTSYYYKFATVDVSGNVSTASSAIGPATPTRITGTEIGRYLAPGANTLQRTPTVVVARKSASEGAAAATATLAGYADYATTTDLDITVIEARAYDVVVVDCGQFSAGEHSEFIRQCWEDGQRVMVTGDNSGVSLFYVLETAAVGSMGQPAFTVPSHPIFSNVGTFSEADAGLRIVQAAPSAQQLAGYSDNAAQFAILALQHASGGLILHLQSPKWSTAGAAVDRLRRNALDYLVGPAVYASTVRARAISTQSLLVGELNNLTENPDFEYGDQGWTKGTGWTIDRTPSNAYAGDFAARREGTGAGSVLANRYQFSCSAGDGFYARAWVISSPPGEGARVRIAWLDIDGAPLSYATGNEASGTPYSLSEATGTAPADTAFARVEVFSDAAIGALVYADRVAMFRTSGAVLIQDGAVIAGKIAANAVDADKITANAITTAKIAAGAVTAEKITATSISSISANLGTITAGTIALASSGAIYAGKTSYASSTAGYWMGFDSGTPKFKIGDATKSLDWNGTDLTVTGVIRTAASGQRVVLTSGNETEFYDDFGTKAVTIGLVPSSGDTVLLSAGIVGATGTQGNRIGIRGFSTANTGVFGLTSTGRGVLGSATGTGTGVVATTEGGIALQAICGFGGIAVEADGGNNATGVLARGTVAGVFDQIANTSGGSLLLRGESSNTSAPTHTAAAGTLCVRYINTGSGGTRLYFQTAGGFGGTGNNWVQL